MIFLVFKEERDESGCEEEGGQDEEDEEDSGSEESLVDSDSDVEEKGKYHAVNVERFHSV